MQRTSTMLLFAIALLAGFTARALLSPAAFSTRVAIGTADVAVGNAFYVALNGALGGGSVDLLAAMLGSAFRDHDPASGATQDADAFLADIRAKNAAPQGVQLTVTSLTASGDSLVAMIEPTRSQPPRVAGVTVDSPLPDAHFETLRVVSGRIVDRWAPAAPWLDAAEAADAAFEVSAMSPLTASLTRVELPDGLEQSWTVDGAGVLLVEAGEARVRIDHGATRGAAMTLELGDAVRVSVRDRVWLRSGSYAPVRLLVFLAEPARAAEAGASRGPPPATEAQSGLSREVLWRGPLGSAELDAAFRAGRVVLPAGGSVEMRSDAGIQVMLAIDRGSVDVHAANGSIVALGSDRWPEDVGEFAQIDATQSGALFAPATVTVRNPTGRPVQLLLITIWPGTSRA